MPNVAKCIYYRPSKILHPYQVLINKKGAFFSRVYATLEEAIAGRDAFLASLKDKLAGGLGEDSGGVVDVGKV